MATWSREALLSFIEIYKSSECLWKIKSKDYSNRILKDKAFDQLLIFTRQYVDANADRDFIAKKN